MVLEPSRKPALVGFRPGNTQTGLFRYRDYVEILNLRCGHWRLSPHKIPMLAFRPFVQTAWADLHLRYSHNLTEISYDLEALYKMV